MPIPTPSKREKRSDFISSCMSDEVMNKDYPDNKQRAAICYSQWERKKSKAGLVAETDNEETIFTMEGECAKE